MPLIKLRRINKGGDIILNTEQIAFIEVDGKSTTVHLAGGLLFSVEESPDNILELATKTSAAPASMFGKPGNSPF